MIPLQLIIHYSQLIIMLLLGLSLGTNFADIDLAPPLPLQHRSAWSHGPFFALSALYLRENFWAQVFFAGFLATYALHLAYDMYPKQWVSIANISLHPLPLRLPGLLSFLYMGASLVFSLWVWVGLFSQWWQLLPVGLGALYYGRKYIAKEPGGWPWPLNQLGLPFGDLPPLATFAGGVVVAVLVGGVL